MAGGRWYLEAGRGLLYTDSRIPFSIAANFLFMFIAVGWQLRKEKKEIEKHQATLRKKQLEEHIKRTQRKHEDHESESDDK